MNNELNFKRKKTEIKYSETKYNNLKFNFFRQVGYKSVKKKKLQIIHVYSLTISYIDDEIQDIHEKASLMHQQGKGYRKLTIRD